MATTKNVAGIGAKQDAEKSASSTESQNWPSPIISAAKAFILKGTDSAETARKVHRGKDPKAIERANLLNVSKLIIKELIDSSLSHGRMLDDDHAPLQQFFVVLEHVLRHGLKPKKGLLRDRRDFWCVLEMVEKYAPDASEITTSVREMPNIKTPLGRARAWLRLAVMQKKLSDYFRLLIDNKDGVLSDFYEPGAMMIEDEGVVIAGMLVGLNVIDCTICIKEEDLDQPIGVIDFSLYLKDGRQNNTTSDMESSNGTSKMATILDQKNYLEELNRHLNATVTNLQQKMETMQTTNALMKEDLAIAKNQIVVLQEEISALRIERDTFIEENKKQLELVKQDIEAERTTYQTSRQGLDNMYVESKKKLEEETHCRLDVERELELQIGMKQEMEMALRLLEKDIHEKQDSIITLRQQLEDIKTINLQMYSKLQSCEGSVKHKTEMVAKLEEKTNQLVNTLKEMEKKLKKCEADKQAAEETARKLGQVIADKDAKRTALETDLKIEREWRASLQRNLEQEKEKVTQIQIEQQQYKSMGKEYEELKKYHKSLQVQCEEQEKALAELGSHLSESKLKMEDLREANMAIREAQWASDRDATNCKQCDRPFSVARRKHHCRNCGDIFCNECSDNKMPHPSSSKPVRVCDICHSVLLQRYSASAN
ncbi:hypothetical protein CHS0354_001166 [Potamilus streckersoni]|uniref:RUN and FYVE domain-containing protein 2 n=1 Tax=Potamilus streckersoni TaxID=2493646 RepID=A0AAE0VQU0_9BIVA|nr:hypothetical protein CHS0354_001166 [Potamilus streckersoni]